MVMNITCSMLFCLHDRANNSINIQKVPSAATYVQAFVCDMYACICMYVCATICVCVFSDNRTDWTRFLKAVFLVNAWCVSEETNNQQLFLTPAGVRVLVLWANIP
jgi:hypothetical protein